MERVGDIKIKIGKVLIIIIDLADTVLAYFILVYSPLIAATPGKILPSMASSIAPPPVET